MNSIKDIKRCNSITIAHQAYFNRKEAIEEGYTVDGRPIDWAYGRMADWSFTSPDCPFYKTVVIKEFKRLMKMDKEKARIYG